MKITVTKKHIKRGKPCNHRFCPVALAVKQKLHTRKVAVWSTAIFIKGEKFAAPEEVRRFTAVFDHPSSRIDVRPFSFELVKA